MVFIIDWLLKWIIIVVLAVLERLGWKRAGKWLDVVLSKDRRVNKDGRPVG
jgi:hypothetical protein